MPVFSNGVHSVVESIFSPRTRFVDFFTPIARVSLLFVAERTKTTSLVPIDTCTGKKRAEPRQVWVTEHLSTMPIALPRRANPKERHVGGVGRI